MRLFLKIIFAIIVTIVAAGFLVTWFAEHDRNQKVFMKGKVPDPLPEGLYRGFGSLQGSWIGKEFDVNTSRGWNVFAENEIEVKKYAFKTYTGKGLKDQDLDVLKIDYNNSEAPFWLRLALDEVVELGPGQYLGKLHIRIPGMTVTIGYFSLEK